jgi:hypothetical protein
MQTDPLVNSVITTQAPARTRPVLKDASNKLQKAKAATQAKTRKLEDKFSALQKQLISLELASKHLNDVKSPGSVVASDDSSLSSHSGTMASF